MHSNVYNVIAIVTGLFTSMALQTASNHMAKENQLRVEHALAHADFAAADAIWKETAPTNTRSCYNAGVYALHNGDMPTARAYFTRATADDTYAIRLAAIQYLHTIGAYTMPQMLVQGCLVAPSWLWVLLALLFALGTLYTRKNTFPSGALRIACLCGIISCVYQYRNGIEHPTVILHESTLLSGPDNSFTPQATLAAGQKVTILQQQDAWTLVRHGKQTGWIAQDHILA